MAMAAALTEYILAALDNAVAAVSASHPTLTSRVASPTLNNMILCEIIRFLVRFIVGIVPLDL